MSQASGSGMAARWAWLDELRGVAVVLMIHTHALTSWLAPPARAGAVYDAYALLFAVPSRLFLFLFGFSLALSARRGARPVVGGLARGLELLAYAFALRLWDWGTRGASDPTRLWKVDILNVMGALALVLAPLAFVRRRSGAFALAVALAAAGVALGALGDGFAPPDSWPTVARAYIAGARPLAHFPLIPWGVYAAAGYAWATVTTAPGAFELRRPARLAAGAGGAAVMMTILVARSAMPIDQVLLQRESDPLLVVATTAGVLALVAAWPALRGAGAGRSFLAARIVELGRASLLVYFVHLGICFGPLSRTWHGSVSLLTASAGAWAVVVLMAGAAHLRLRLPPIAAVAALASWGRSTTPPRSP